MTQTVRRPDSFNTNSNSERHLTMYLTLSAHTCQFLFIKRSGVHLKVTGDWILWHLNRATRLAQLSLLQLVAAWQLRRAGPALHREPGQSRPLLFLTYNFAALCWKSPFMNMLCGSKYKQIFSTCPSPDSITGNPFHSLREAPRQRYTFFTSQQCGAHLIYTLSNGLDSGVYDQQLLIT